MHGFRLGDAGLDLLLVGDVGVDGDALHLGRDLLGILLALVEHRDLCALGGHGARGGGAQAGATAGDENSNVFQLHRQSLSLGVSLRFFSGLVFPRVISPGAFSYSYFPWTHYSWTYLP